jgi:nitronate monooxygenase
VSALLERLGVDLPIFQAGMGGGLARHELAAAVSEAGGLGTLGIVPPEALAAELDAAKALTGKPIAVNLLLPFARRSHLETAARADAVVTFWGRPRRPADRIWLHQCGSVEEAKAAAEAGVDGVIAQGVEAGGHVRGTTPGLELLGRIRAALRKDFPIALAGGIAERADVSAALQAGADAAVAGTRFLMSPESHAHPAYRQRLMEARETVLTELFGAGWPNAPHRVIWNEAAERWLRGDPRGPAAVRTVQRLLSPGLSRLPPGVQARLGRLQRPGSPLLSPAPPTDGDSTSLVDATALYAGETVARIHDVRPAAELTRELGGG